MKKIVLCLIGIINLIIYVYVLSIDTIPNNIILFADEDLNINTLFGITCEKVLKNEEPEAIQVSSNLNKNTVGEKSTLLLKLFNKITLKEVEVDVISDVKVVPVGNIIGLKLYTKGVLVVGMNEIENVKNEVSKPYENAGIAEGDIIVSVNNNAITCTSDLLEEVKKSAGKEIEIKYLRKGNLYETGIIPQKTEDNQFKLGLWVRDSAAGVGTITYYEPSTGRFAALGHGILDIDTRALVEIANGEIVTADILSVQKGEKGIPGEIRGSIVNGNTIGKISKNTDIGIYGTLENLSQLNIDTSKSIEIAKRNEIKIGKAKIICTLENNETKEYEVEIQKIDILNNENNKSMIIKITDKELLEKTNGIIQGMSGSPIIQNGKLVGAITQVFVSSPNMGYGVFADLMIKEMKKTE